MEYVNTVQLLGTTYHALQGNMWLTVVTKWHPFVILVTTLVFQKIFTNERQML